MTNVEPRVVYPHSPRTDETILQPDLNRHPWYEFVVHPWSNRVTRNLEEEKVVEDTFDAFDELPPEFDPWSEPLKRAPPEFFLGWPLDMALVRAYALKNDMAYFKNRYNAAGVRISGGYMQAHEVTSEDVLNKISTLTEIQLHLLPRVKIEEAYGVPNVEGRFGGLWSLCSNWTHPDRRPSEEEIAQLQEELGYKDKPKWHMTTFA
ncbi:hypothetical protein PUNSTDRAFT_138337 [Punctularia strigosozonata HHB-11173 SS5]|uniref:Uncharacterized protein n=1 Tax=Punctularia strigosozonata (strain HHB-11173) TaxID=741275 RepID=R7S393_PUNST|nr:uncharacterized protein PUNSTDRAFT_138337 [Punctularia strigosozonata HHB-11173 SS5]EIN04693.1 hypothetical protein PUNSTDRAFT_138337 [Punctularia strigosozonata HHB-11173 SS5]